MKTKRLGGQARAWKKMEAMGGFKRRQSPEGRRLFEAQQRKLLDQEIAHADAIARNEGVNFGHLLDPDFDNLDVIGSLAT